MTLTFELILNIAQHTQAKFQVCMFNVSTVRAQTTDTHIQLDWQYNIVHRLGAGL